MKNYLNYYLKFFIINFIYKLRKIRKKEIKYNKDLKTYWENEEKRKIWYFLIK